jgi:tetratricopeptide (TPR) repeat protein
MATVIPAMKIGNIRRLGAARPGWIVAIFLFAAAGLAVAGDAQKAIFIARAQVKFHRAQKQFESNTNDVAAAVRFARTCFDFANITTNDTTRAEVARQGIVICRGLVARDPKLAAGHYYLAMNLGELARTELLGALKIVKEMEREFKKADALDEHLDYAGPARSLGLLYRDAPGWPASIGSRRKARQWLEQAVKLAPDFPENRLNLAESCLEWKDLDRAKEELDALDALWPKAQTNFTGETWEQTWDDWSTRRDNARKRLIAISPPPIPAKNRR